MNRVPRGRAVRILLVLALAGAASLVGGAVPATAAPMRTTFSGGPLAIGSGGLEFEPGFPAYKDVPSAGPAARYPDTIAVPHPGLVTGVQVTLRLLHPRQQDLDVLLVGPHGETVTLMSDAGGSVLNPASPRVLVFSDDADDLLPEGAPAEDGDWLPTDYGAEVDVFPPPAPSASGSTSLSDFAGTPAAGTWSLYVVDDEPAGDPGAFDWTITLDVATASYPSTIAVSGVGTVTDVNVVLTDLNSTFPTDMDLLLVGPQGQVATVLSDAGGEFDLEGYDVVLSDEAPLQAPDEAPLVEPRYRPANWSDQDDGFVAPAPPQNPQAALTIFDGTDPNGAWRLFAQDDGDGDYGVIGGWALEITWDDSGAPAGSVTVAAGAARTRTADVTLGLTATDPLPSSGVQVRLSNDGSTWSAYRPVTPTTSWTLSAGDGAKTVHAQFRDGAGNLSTVATDAIVLDSKAPVVRKRTPEPKARDVKPRTKVKVVLSEPLDSATVGKKAVVLATGKQKVKAKVRYQAGKNLLVLTPKKPLQPGKYTVTVAGSVADLAGNLIDGKAKPGTQRVRWRFRV